MNQLIVIYYLITAYLYPNQETKTLQNENWKLVSYYDEGKEYSLNDSINIYIKFTNSIVTLKKSKKERYLIKGMIEYGNQSSIIYTKGFYWLNKEETQFESLEHKFDTHTPFPQHLYKTYFNYRTIFRLLEDHSITVLKDRLIIGDKDNFCLIYEKENDIPWRDDKLNNDNYYHKKVRGYWIREKDVE